ncbi:MAG: hypothetical protein JNL01_05825 [Bdellovibrionales bacterium]|nr:hypothetical protein [Bdellovibrionales bacterium]
MKKIIERLATFADRVPEFAKIQDFRIQAWDGVFTAEAVGAAPVFQIPGLDPATSFGIGTSKDLAVMDCASALLEGAFSRLVDTPALDAAIQAVGAGFSAQTALDRARRFAVTQAAVDFWLIQGWPIPEVTGSELTHQALKALGLSENDGPARFFSAKCIAAWGDGGGALHEFRAVLIPGKSDRGAIASETGILEWTRFGASVFLQHESEIECWKRILAEAKKTVSTLGRIDPPRASLQRPVQPAMTAVQTKVEEQIRRLEKQGVFYARAGIRSPMGQTGQSGPVGDKH